MREDVIGSTSDFIHQNISKRRFGHYIQVDDFNYWTRLSFGHEVKINKDNFKDAKAELGSDDLENFRIIRIDSSTSSRRMHSAWYIDLIH